MPLVIDAKLHRDLTFDHEAAGTFDIEATTRNGELRLTGQSDFARGKLSVNGNVMMRDDYPAKITATMDQLDVDSLWRAYLGPQLTAHTGVVGTVTMQGPLRYPRQWTLNGTMPEVAIEVEHTKLHNDGPLMFTYAQQTIQIEPAHLVGEGTDLTGNGSLHFAGSKEIQLNADGHADLKLLGSLDPNLTASGLTTIHMTVSGTLTDPFRKAPLISRTAEPNMPALPSGLSEMNGSLSFTRDRIHIDQLAAHTGGGTLELERRRQQLQRATQFQSDGNGKDVRLRYPPGVSSTATAELHWVGSLASSTVSGDVLVTKLAVTPGFDFGSYLERSRQSAAITPANSPLYNVKLDVAVRTAPELQMKTAVARLSGDADLAPARLGGAAQRAGPGRHSGRRCDFQRDQVPPGARRYHVCQSRCDRAAG